MKKAITIKGIQRNATKLGVEDGRSDDLINLRFKDGSWRTSGDGMQVFSIGHTIDGIPSVSETYTQLYIHTNIYRHVLGVNGGTLYWFADIDANGVFNSKDTPMPICQVAGNITITQVANLISVISDLEGINYALFDEKQMVYNSTDIDENGVETSRELYPFGAIHFNLDCRDTKEHKNYVKVSGDTMAFDGMDDLNHRVTSDLYDSSGSWHSNMLKAFNQATENNQFTRPFLVMVAPKLYDGTYTLASQPILLWPREKLSSGDFFVREDIDGHIIYDNVKDYKFSYMPYDSFIVKLSGGPGSFLVYEDISGPSVMFDAPNGGFDIAKGKPINKTPFLPTYSSSAHGRGWGKGRNAEIGGGQQCSLVIGADIVLSIKDVSKIIDNNKVFTGIGIFVTKQVDYLDTNNEGDVFIAVGASFDYFRGQFTYKPKFRDRGSIIYDLANSPFYLLRDYSIKELNGMPSTFKVDLTDEKYKGILSNITAQPTFTSEAISRTSYIPKVAYNYNSRLHLANYKSNIFHGYPIDSLLWSNHFAEYKYGSKSFGDEKTKRLKDLEDLDELQYCQFNRNTYPFLEDGLIYDEDTMGGIGSFLAINITIETEKGKDAIVTRYIKPYKYNNNDIFPYGIEDLPAFISYPDYRARQMEIIFTQIFNHDVEGLKARQVRFVFQLEQHPYINLAYNITDDLHPRSIGDIISGEVEQKTTGDDWNYREINLPITDDILKQEWKGYKDEVATTSFFPNGLKVSDSQNPLQFPYENTYQIGSSEIVGICSNAVAIGTGQTGASPLFVFAKDGVYALLVDSSGKMTYTNARIISRDICNKASSITPIDGGIVFTTERGLMNISGNKVSEIGQIAEGEAFEYVDDSVDGKLIPKTSGKNIMTKIAELPTSLCDGEDFLEYINSGDGCKINYNYNLRELIVCNPNYSYCYVLDNVGNWSRRDYSAQEFVNNYPTSYRLFNGDLMQIDKELKLNDDADNNFIICSDAIKLDTIDFKQSHRFIVRGEFITQDHEKGHWEVTEGHEEEYKPSITVSDSGSVENIEEQQYIVPIERLIGSREYILEEGKNAEINVLFDSESTVEFITKTNNQFLSGKDNTAQFSYRVTNEYGKIVSVKRFTSYKKGNDRIVIDFYDNDYTIRLEKAGTYKFEIYLDYIYLYLEDITPGIEQEVDVYCEEDSTIHTDDDSTMTDGHISNYSCQYTPHRFSITKPTGKIKMVFNGYADFVCGKDENDEYLCKIKEMLESNSVIKMRYSIFKEDNGTSEKIWSSKPFYSELVDDYTLRVRFDAEKDDGEDENEEPLPKQYEEQEIVIQLEEGDYYTQLEISDMDVYLQGIKLEEQPDINNDFTISKEKTKQSDDEDVLEANVTINKEYSVSVKNGKLLGIKFSDSNNNHFISTVEASQTIAEQEGAASVTLSSQTKNPYDTKSQLIDGIGFYIVDSENLTVYSKVIQFVKESGDRYKADFGEQSGTIDVTIKDGEYKLIVYCQTSATFNRTGTLSGDSIFKLSNELTNAVVDIKNGYYRYEFREILPTPATTEDGDIILDERQRVENHVTEYEEVSYQLSYDWNIRVDNLITVYVPTKKEWIEGDPATKHLGLYVYGSYDGRQWTMLGGKEKTGHFNDIGCITERTDVKFLRYVLAGNIKGESRIDYIEVEGAQSDLKTKLR